MTKCMSIDNIILYHEIHYEKSRVGSMKGKLEKATDVGYSTFWTISQELFIKHKPWNWKEFASDWKFTAIIFFLYIRKNFQSTKVFIYLTHLFTSLHECNLQHMHQDLVQVTPEIPHLSFLVAVGNLLTYLLM